MMRRAEFGRSQKGFTIVEFLVAGTLGLILLAGFIRLFIGSSQSFRIQEGISSINDSGRFVTQMLGDELLNAGFIDLEYGGSTAASEALKWPVAFDPDPAVCEDEDDGASCEGEAATDPAGIAKHSDRLQVRYQARRDCLGAEVAGGKVGVVVNTYFVRNFTKQSDGVVLGELACRGTDGSIQPLVSNVESFQLEYGVDDNGDSTADRYLPANDVDVDFSDLRIDRVVAVRFAILIASEAETLDAPRDTSLDDNVIQLLGEANIERNDRRLRRVFSRTVAMPNAVN